MRVLQVSAELFPWLKTGGLADVTGALPAALQALGCDVRVLLPGFPGILAGLNACVDVGQFTTPWGSSVTLRLGQLGGAEHAPIDAYVVDAPDLFDRPGSPYEDAQRRPYSDNHRRFAALGWAAAQLGCGLDRAWSPQLVHGHDWHAGLAAACLKLWPDAARRQIASVFTVHNLAYQGVFAAHHMSELGLPGTSFNPDGLEFHGQISFMKAGIYYADHITTVSPTYAREIQTAEQGCGLDGLLRARRDHLSGILNGVDDTVWNPALDPQLVQCFDSRRPAGKAACKAALQLECGLLPEPDVPLFSVVSRLTEQKGLPLVLAGVDGLMDQGGQLLVLGSGDIDLEHAFTRASQRYPGRIAVRLGYDEALAHRCFGGSDVTLVPSRFEPCGLTQMYGLKYGSLPLVRAVGGLVDTVVDADLATLEDRTATGFVFQGFTSVAYDHAVRRAMALYRRRRAWATVRQTGMRCAFNWKDSASEYMAVYRSLVPN